MRRKLDLQIERIFSFFSFFFFEDSLELQPMQSFLNEIIMESKQGLFPRPVYSGKKKKKLSKDCVHKRELGSE